MIALKNSVQVRDSLTAISLNLYKEDLVRLAEIQEAVKQYEGRYISRSAIVRCAVQMIYNNINAPGDLKNIKDNGGD